MLEVYWSKVNLNMFLAEAFKIKCTDAKPGSQPSRPGTKHFFTNCLFCMFHPCKKCFAKDHCLENKATL